MRRVGAIVGLAMIGCGSIVEVPSRDLDTAGYASVAFRVPSFWTDSVTVGQSVLIPVYLDDENPPGGADAGDLRDIVEAAVATWLEPLDAAGRRVRVPVLLASRDPRPTGMHVFVRFVNRGTGWIGRTLYDTDQVTVELSVRAASVDRALTRRELLALTLHEFGHALGISRTAPGETEAGPPSHSANPNDVMFGHNLDQTWITLSEGDRATILALFPEP